MSVATTTPVSSGTGNGVLTTFAFSFKVFLATDVVFAVETAVGSGVYLNLIYSIDYTVAFDTANETGTVTTLVAVGDGRKWSATRLMAVTQGSVLPLEGKMPAKVVENGLDRLTLLIQELKALLTLPFTPSPAPSVLTDFVLKYEGLYANKPAAPVLWMLWYSTDRQTLEVWVPTAGKWFLIG